MSSELLDFESCKFNEKNWFIAQVTTDGVFVRTPQDLMIPICDHAELRVNLARAVFIADACNKELALRRFKLL